MITIPLSTDQLFSQVTTLSGTDYIFTFAWNEREDAWYMDLADQDGVAIQLSRKVTVDFPLITRCKDPRRPLGMLIAVDSSGAGLDPTLEDFGQRVQLVYFEPEEV